MRKIFICSLLILGFTLALPCQNAATQNARPATETLNRMMVYQVWMRSFTPEGTLKATATHLQYIADLGANAIQISPINVFGYPSVFGPTTPYEIKDYDKIDPEFGSEADFKAFVDEAHKSGLKVIMDVVYAHSANDSVLLGRPGFYQRNPDGSILLSRWRTPMPDFKNPQVQEYFRNNMLHWVRDVGVDGFRVDWPSHIPLKFWEDAREAMDSVNPNVIMVAEADVPEHQLKAFDISYNFPYYSALTAVIVNGEPATRIREQWEKARAAFPRGSRFLHLNDNHDRDRAEVVFGEKGAMASSVLDFTLDGIPFLYNGEEVGDTTPPNQRAHVAMRFEVWPTNALRLTSAARQQTRLRFYKRLFQMRGQEAALTSGELTWIGSSNPDGVVSFIRKKGGEEILTLVNLSNRITKVEADAPASDYSGARDLVTGRPAPASLSSGKYTCQLGAFGYVVVKRASGSK